MDWGHNQLPSALDLEDHLEAVFWLPREGYCRKWSKRHREKWTPAFQSLHTGRRARDLGRNIRRIA